MMMSLYYIDACSVFYAERVCSLWYVDGTAGAMDEVLQPALKRLKVGSSGDQSDSDGKYRTFQAA